MTLDDQAFMEIFFDFSKTEFLLEEMLTMLLVHT
jgi:hypothetical protein